ncbi:carbon-nitrogen hydrolase family protein [Amaricoccus sp.]|uniref:carbon-nitrogen hydrolase family protein n=1 Tax=Amaricoccus sp. TaxID=1872485 RepID=UPI001B50F05A|nr:carbon-nitrogen hydrolase family protein [Amaricoccus sp.]MBP7241308.1 carbon-nitrogen hydrolase family protein [Amaricoccus sp.]
MRAGLVQLCSGDDPAANLSVTEALVREAAAGGAELVLTPECTNLMSSSRAVQAEAFVPEADDPTLAHLREVAAELGIWLLIGSLGLRTSDPDGRFANRGFLVAPDGAVAARYDKIHMFDVELASGESYRESAAFRPGDRAVVAQAGQARLGMTICYDLRFPGLYRALAKGGAEIIAVPSAFTVPTGEAHWRALLRARAIETGAFVLAPAQSGAHPTRAGKPRRTWGHSLAVSPWGAVLADAGEAVGVTLVDLDLGAVARARAQVPSLRHDRPFAAPEAP